MTGPSWVVLSGRGLEPENWATVDVGERECDEVQLGIDSRELTRRYDGAWPASSGIIIIFALPSREAVDEKFAQLTGS